MEAMFARLGFPVIHQSMTSNREKWQDEAEGNQNTIKRRLTMMRSDATTQQLEEEIGKQRTRGKRRYLF